MKTFLNDGFNFETNKIFKNRKNNNTEVNDCKKSIVLK